MRLSNVFLMFALPWRKSTHTIVYRKSSILQPYNDTAPTISDSYLRNIEKTSKLRNHAPSYLDTIEKGRRQKRLPAVSRTRETQLVPQIVSLRPRESTRKKPSKSSENGQFTMESDSHLHNFTCIGGYDAVKEELTQVGDMMLYPGNYTQYNIRIPRGILLEGPPGNGKTLIAKCFAGEVNANFIRCAGSEFNEKYIGVGSSRLRELFQFASDNQPSIIFIDEFDAVGRKRAGGEDTSGGERDTTLNQLLVLMDGFQSAGNVLIMAATNRIDILDSAVTRPGRFDKIINIPNPDAKTRKSIIDIHRRHKPLNVATDDIVRLTTGFSGAMIENLLNEATLHGIRKKCLPITYDKLDEIRQQLIFGGISVMSRNISESVQRRIAIHETGHLINALVCDYYDKPIRVSISTQNRMSLGQTVFEKDEIDDGIFIRDYLDEKLRVLLGGRAAEEIVYGHSTSSGSVADLETSFQLVKRMILEFGMGNHIVYPFLSEEYKKRIDDEIHAYIHLSYQQAKNVIEQNLIVFDLFVEALIDNGTLLQSDIQKIIDDHHLYKISTTHHHHDDEEKFEFSSHNVSP